MDDEEGCSAPKRSRLESPSEFNNENNNTRDAGDSTKHSTADANDKVGDKDLVSEKVVVDDTQSNSINEDEVVNEKPSDSLSHAKAVENDSNNLIDEVTAANNKLNNSLNPGEAVGDVHNDSVTEDGGAILNNEVQITHNDPINTKASEDNLNDVTNDGNIVKSIPDNLITEVDNSKNKNKSNETVSTDAVDGVFEANNKIDSTNQAIAVENISDSSMNVTTVSKDSMNENMTTETVPNESIKKGIANENNLITQDKTNKDIPGSSINMSAVLKNSLNESMSPETILNNPFDDDDDSMNEENYSINQDMTAVNNSNYVKSNAETTASNPNNSANITKGKKFETNDTTNIANVSIKQDIVIPSPSSSTETANIEKSHVIRLKGVPNSWDETAVRKFIMQHMGEHYKPGIIKCIEKVTYPNCDYAPWFITFTALHHALKALNSLINEQETYEGEKIHIKRKLLKDCELPCHTIKQSQATDLNTESYTLQFSNVPRDYTAKTLLDYIKQRTQKDPNIVKSITKINFGGNLKAYVEFAYKKPYNEALTILKSTKNKVYRDGKLLCYVTSAPIRPRSSFNPTRKRAFQMPEEEVKKEEVKKEEVKKDEVKKESTLAPVSYAETLSSWNKSLNCQTRNSHPINNANGVCHFATQYTHDGKKGSVFYNDLNAKESSDYLAYGLTAEFLQSYKIAIPIKNKVFVDNVNLQYKDELLCRNLFGHAGIVLTLTLVGINPSDPETFRMIVEYDHPLEAVQAITMFHNQVLLRKKLIVKMDLGSKKGLMFLPRGLERFGPGLGYDGLPLRGIRTKLETDKSKSTILQKIEHLKNDLTQETKETIIQEINKRDVENTQQMKSIEGNQPDASQVINSLVSSMSNTQNNPLMALSGLAPILQLLLQQNAPNINQGSQGLNMNQGMNQGSQGLNTTQGLQGLNTTQGSQGLNMIQGSQGLNMIQGSQGLNMNQGLQGLNMNQGSQGLNINQGMNQGSQRLNINQGMNQGSQGLNMNQDRPPSRWDIQPQIGNVAQNSNAQFNAPSGPDFQNMQNQGPMQNLLNISSPNMQHFNLQMEQLAQSGANPQAFQGGLDMQGLVNSLAWTIQGGYNAQGGQNAQMGLNNMQTIQNPQMGAQGGFNMQGGNNQSGMQGVGNNQMGTNILNAQLGAFKSQEEQLQSMAIQGGFNVQGVPSPQLGAVQGGFVQGVPTTQTPMQGGYNVQGGQNVHDGRNMEGGQILHGGTNMQGGSSIPIIPATQNVAQVKNPYSPIMQSKTRVPTIEKQPRSESKVINIAPIKSIGQGSLNYDNEKPKSSVDSDASRTVLFEYLPPSVTQSALEAKMSEIGEIKKAILTGPGRAMVIFHSLRDADDCIKLLHETKVDGQRIMVKAFTAYVGT